VNELKRLLQWHTVVLLLVAGSLVAVSAQTPKLESLTARAKGHGIITAEVEKQKITSALVVLRPNGTALITVSAELQLQAEGTWKASTSSPDEILLKITGGALPGELTGSGDLLLTRDQKSFKKLSVNMKSAIGEKITVTFVADQSEPPE